MALFFFEGSIDPAVLPLVEEKDAFAKHSCPLIFVCSPTALLPVRKKAYRVAPLLSGYPKSELNKMDSKKRQIVADGKTEKPIRDEVYSELDTDLARNNVENDIPAADLQDL